MHLKEWHPERKIIFQPSIFRGYVSFREGRFFLGGFQRIPPWELAANISQQTYKGQFIDSFFRALKWGYVTSLECTNQDRGVSRLQASSSLHVNDLKSTNPLPDFASISSTNHAIRHPCWPLGFRHSQVHSLKNLVLGVGCEIVGCYIFLYQWIISFAFKKLFVVYYRQFFFVTLIVCDPAC